MAPPRWLPQSGRVEYDVIVVGARLSGVGVRVAARPGGPAAEVLARVAVISNVGVPETLRLGIWASACPLHLDNRPQGAGCAGQ